ncbi:hypothetical protein [Vulcanococcus sp. Clear-D1]|uniref:hypothetical protein n=1 Tax=Vulcanococcus sp. Clear-D1 TaxID=2766970 RepID=UPI0019C936FF|nr:hypothetical protein [Vulcanococcus sp. Clear-D1]MBD1194672.1 hypothetical protein [Vulcanococcus sp. Clear-D1]
MPKSALGPLNTASDIIDALTSIESGQTPALKAAIRNYQRIIRKANDQRATSSTVWRDLYQPVRQLLQGLGYQVKYGQAAWVKARRWLNKGTDRPDKDFDIELRIQAQAFSNLERAEVHAMADLMERIVIKDVPDINIGKRVIDDLEVKVKAAPLDSAALAQCKVLTARYARATPANTVHGALPLQSVITVNSNYKEELLDHELLDDVILHEMFHALGFDGSILKQKMLIGYDYSFGGSNARQALEWAVNTLSDEKRHAIDKQEGLTGGLYIDNSDATSSHWAFGFFQQKQPFFAEERSLPADQPFLSKDIVSGQALRPRRLSGELMTAITPGHKTLFVQPWLSWTSIAALEDLGYHTIFGQQAKLGQNNSKAHMVAIDFIEPNAAIQDLFL